MKNKGEILASILTNFKDCIFYLHNTKDFHVAESIMNDGFIFESQLSHSTDRINPYETIEVTYFLFQRKDYGSYTMIIAIPKSVYETYMATANQSDMEIEEVMTVTEPFYSDNDELVYTISPKHILGYFNNRTGDFHQNRNWDPFFNNSGQKKRTGNPPLHFKKL